jgi:hypothetical protein
VQNIFSNPFRGSKFSSLENDRNEHGVRCNSASMLNLDAGRFACIRLRRTAGHKDMYQSKTEQCGDYTLETP